MLRNRSRHLVAALIVSVATHVPAPVAAQTGPEGRWQGEIETPGTPLGVTVELTREGDAWSGTIDIPVQGAMGLALENVRVAGDSVAFAIPGVPGAPTFRGVLDGDRIAGTFTQGAGSFPFALERHSGAEMQAALEGLDTWLAEQMEAWKVPGLAVAIVKDDEVVYEAGHGLRNVGDSLPATEHTLFAIGSATKAFTTALLGTLVDEGRLDWDDPVRKHLPDLALADTAVADRLTVRDMVTHRSGLPRHDAVWYANPALGREAMIARLAHLPPTRDLRGAWQYNNLMFTTAGYLGGEVAGASWEDAVRERLLEPLGMERSTFSVSASQTDADHARPYAERDDSVFEVPFRTIDAVGPAGSINSSVSEMAAWVRMQLAGGEIDGTRVLETGTVHAMQTPQMAISSRPTDADLGIQAYGLGWFVDSYRGHYRVHHGGNIDGFSALVSLFPHEQLGLVVLTNKAATPLPEMVVRQVADRVLGHEPRDWSGEALARREQARARADSTEEAADERVEGTRPSHDLAAYAATYRHPGYGDVVVTNEGDELRFAYYDLPMKLEHVHYDVFEAEDPEGLSPFSGTRVRFVTGFDGGIEALEVALEPQLAAARFARAPEERLTEAAFLDRLAGRYVYQGQVITVSRRGDRLAVSIPGQPTYGLEPERDTSFTLAEAPTIRVSFDVPDQGPAEAVTFHQPNGTFRYTRVTGDDPGAGRG